METPLPFLFPAAPNKKASPAKATKVLLLCVKNKSKCLLTETYLYNLFSEHGIPQKVLFLFYQGFLRALDPDIREKHHLEGLHRDGLGKLGSSGQKRIE